MQIQTPILLLISAIALTSFTYVQDSKFETYSTDDYRIAYPEDWTQVDENELGIELILRSPKHGDTDDFLENVNLVRENLGDDKISLKQYAKAAKKQVEATFKDLEFGEDELLNSNGTKSYRINYTSTFGPYKLHLVQQIWIHDGQAFLLTFSSKVEEFEAYQEIGFAILNSFELK